MKKSGPAILCALLLLAVCLTAAAEEPVYEIRRITTSLLWDDGVSTQSETGVTEYDERGLVTSVTTDAHGLTARYNFFYTFDQHGNPKTITVVDAEENSSRRTVTHEIQTEYEGTRVVSVSGPVIWGIPLYDIIGEYIGYRSAIISDSALTCQNQDGHCVMQRTRLGLSQDRYAEQQWEYRDDRLVRSAFVESMNEIGQSGIETFYRPDGLPESMVQTYGGTVIRGDFVYAEGLDDEGTPCLTAHADFTSSAETDQRSQCSVWGYLSEDGSVATRMQVSDRNGIIYDIFTRDDRHGNRVYQELIFHTAAYSHQVMTAEYEYR